MRYFRSVWSADAQAHSSTLQSRVWGEEGGEEKSRDLIWTIVNIALSGNGVWVVIKTASEEKFNRK